MRKNVLYSATARDGLRAGDPRRNRTDASLPDAPTPPPCPPVPRATPADDPISRPAISAAFARPASPARQYQRPRDDRTARSVILAKGGRPGYTVTPPSDPGLQAGSRDQSDMARRKHDRDAKPPTTDPDGTDQDPLADDLLRALRGFLSIPGVEGIGRPVTVLSPSDLPPDFLGLVERLRAGAVEADEEMILLTIPTPLGRRRGKHPVADRLRRSLLLLCRHALESGVPAGDLIALLDAAKRGVVARGAYRDGRSGEVAKPTTGRSGPLVEGG